MFFRNKHANVIFFSTIIIMIVLVSTLAGYTLYVQWKESGSAARYRNSIYKITAEMFRKEIVLSNASVRIWEGAPFPGMPVFEGSIKNNSQKAVTSVTVEMAFRRKDGSVAYRAWIRPLWKDGVPAGGAPEGVRTQNALLPGESVTFRRFLKNCPREVAQPLSKKSKLSKGGSAGHVSLECAIAGVSVQ